MTLADIDRDLTFTTLPPDFGHVTPIEQQEPQAGSEIAQQLQYIRKMLPLWPPAKATDPVQRARNILYIVAVPDLLQIPLERFAPQAVFEYLQHEFPKDQLIKILYWIALHPAEGDDAAVRELSFFRLNGAAVDPERIRDRVVIYGEKLLGRLLGKLPLGTA